jgi:hypothetical protein
VGTALILARSKHHIVAIHHDRFDEPTARGGWDERKVRSSMAVNSFSMALILSPMPSRADQRLTLATASFASTGSPSWNLRPGRSRNVQASPSKRDAPKHLYQRHTGCRAVAPRTTRGLIGDWWKGVDSAPPFQLFAHTRSSCRRLRPPLDRLCDTRFDQ